LQNSSLDEKIEGYKEALLETVEYNKDDNLADHIDKLCNKLLNVSDLFLLQAYKINIAHKAIESMQQLIKDIEKDIKALETQAVHTQKHSKIFICDENDELDKSIADYIKKLGKPLPVGLVKVSDGLYLCGEQKIVVEIINNKLIVNPQDLKLEFHEFIQNFFSFSANN
jgi:hypothetical protein